MPTSKRIELFGLDFSGTLYDELMTFMRPLALGVARDRVARMEDGDFDPLPALGPVERGELAARQLRDAKAEVERGGDILWSSWNVTTRDGIEHTTQLSMPGETISSPDPSLLVDATQVRLVMFVSQDRWASANSFVIDISSGAGWGSATVTAPDGLLGTLGDQLEALISRHSKPVPTMNPQPFKVFIAYGGGPAWEMVRDYLKRADIEVDAFTEKQRAGQVTIDVVSEMIRSATVAVIVMTAAEELKAGSWFARQNVIHEAGFAQAVLGVRNTIILLEEGVEIPSNLAGVTYIKFPRGAIHKTEDAVLAIVRESKADFENGGPRFGVGYGGGC